MSVYMGGLRIQTLAQRFAAGAIAKERDFSTLALLDEALERGDIEQQDLQLDLALYTQALAEERDHLVEALGPLIAEKLQKRAGILEPLLDREPIQRFADSAQVVARAKAALGRRKELEAKVEYVGRYRIDRTIDERSLGLIQAAADLATGKTVAIKTLRRHLLNDTLYRQMFDQEIQTLSRLRHPNIIELTGLGENYGLAIGEDEHYHPFPYFVMEYVDSPSLLEEIERRGALPWPRAKKILLQVAEAVGVAHANEIIFRDLKPGNVLLIQKEDREEAKLIDFGLVVDRRDSQQLLAERGEGVVYGTPAYMAPEQWDDDGAIDFRIDVYAFGLTMYEMLAGKMPFVAETREQYENLHRFAVPPSVREVRPDLDIPACAEAIILKAMAKNPRDRYSSMSDVEAALRACP